MDVNEEEKVDENEYEEEEDCQFIDPSDLIMINDPNSWEPGPQFIVAYANQLGFDKDKDPKAILNIAEKYLNYKLPENIVRAFTKSNLQILYIDKNTNEIKLTSELEEQAKEEIEKIRQQYKNSLKNNLNKIAPINNKKKII